MIHVESRKVYTAKTRGRSYFTKKAAVHQETMAILRRKYPTESFEHDTGYSFDVRDFDKFDVMYRRLSRIVEKNIN